MTEEQEDQIVDSLASIAKSLEVLSGRVDNGHMPGPIEAIAMVLGARDELSFWPDHGDILERIATALEREEE